MTQIGGRPYTVDDLPRFSPWPARLLGLEPWAQRVRTPEDTIREYDLEKWGPLLERMIASRVPISLEEVDDWAREGAPPSLCSIDGGFELLSAKDGHARYLDLAEAELTRYGPATALVELGAGYGSIILALAGRSPFSSARLAAAEYTDTGARMLKMLAASSGIDLMVGRCDFASAETVSFEMPRRSTVFTSYAIPYLPRLEGSFVDALCDFDPLVVVHFEPCYEHCDEDTTLGLMRRRYIEVNDYNTNLVSVLHRAESAGSIRILDERKAVFGINPLLAASIIAWAPSG